MKGRYNMDLVKAIKLFTTIKPGTYQRFLFHSEVPVKAAYKKSVCITKQSCAVARFGISYKNIIKKDTNKKDSKKYIKNPNKYWIFKNIIEYNKNTDKFYVNAYKSSTRPVVTYYVYKDNSVFITKNKDDIKEYVIDSYFKKSNDGPLYKVCLNNVLSIGKGLS